MTDDFIWGGFNLRKFCKLFFRNLWTIIAVMIITYLGLTLVDKQTDAPSYTSTAVAAVYPVTSHYRYHTIETISDLSSKTGVIASVINSDMFRSEFHNQYPDLEDFTFDCIQVPNTDLLIIRGTCSNPKNAFEGIRTALESSSRISGGMTGNPECNKKTLLASSYAGNKEGTAVLSELARELAEQNEKVILIGTGAGLHEGAPGFVLSDDMKEYTLQDVLQQKCTVKDAMFYSEELSVHCIQFSPESTDATDFLLLCFKSTKGLPAE